MLMQVAIFKTQAMNCLSLWTIKTLLAAYEKSYRYRPGWF
jgi:hypothetical protein